MPVDPVATASAGFRLVRFVNASTHVNDEIRALKDELEGLKSTAATVTAILGERELDAFEVASISTPAFELVRLCEKATREFELQIRSLRPSPNERWTPGDLVRQGRVTLKVESIATMRAQIHTHSVNLNTVIGGLQIHISALTAPTVLDILAPKLEVLLRQLQTNLGQMATETSEEIALKSQTTRLKLATEETLKRVTVKPVVAIAQGLSPAKKMEVGIPSASHKHISMTSSIVSQNDDMNELINEQVADRDDSSNSAAVSSKMYARYSRVGIWASEVEPCAPDRTSIPPDTKDLEAANFKSLLARNAIREAELALSRDDCAGAEKLLRSVLEDTSVFDRLSRLSMPNARRHVKVNLAIALFRQRKFDDAIRETAWLDSHTIRDDDDDRNVVFEGYHTLAQIQLVKDDLSEALRISNICMFHFPWMMEERHLQARWYHAVALHVAVSYRLGNQEQARIFAGLLPEDFIRPEFDLSHVWLPRIDESPSIRLHHVEVNTVPVPVLPVQVHELDMTSSSSAVAQMIPTERVPETETSTISMNYSALPLLDDVNFAMVSGNDTAAVLDRGTTSQPETPDDTSVVYYTARTSRSSYFGLGANRNASNGLGIDMTGDVEFRNKRDQTVPPVPEQLDRDQAVSVILPTIEEHHDISLLGTYQSYASAPDRGQTRYPESLPSLSPSLSSCHTSSRGSWGSEKIPVVPTFPDSDPNVAELPDTSYTSSTVFQSHAEESSPRGRHRRSDAQSGLLGCIELQMPPRDARSLAPSPVIHSEGRAREARSLTPTPRPPVSPLFAEFAGQFQDERYVISRSPRQGMVFIPDNLIEQELQVSSHFFLTIIRSHCSIVAEEVAGLRY